MILRQVTCSNTSLRPLASPLQRALLSTSSSSLRLPPPSQPPHLRRRPRPLSERSHIPRRVREPSSAPLTVTVDPYPSSSPREPTGSRLPSAKDATIKAPSDPEGVLEGTHGSRVLLEQEALVITRYEPITLLSSDVGSFRSSPT
jgi:hypothetical protein